MAPQDHEGHILIGMSMPVRRADFLRHLEQASVCGADHLLRPELGEPSATACTATRCRHIGRFGSGSGVRLHPDLGCDRWWCRLPSALRARSNVGVTTASSSPDASILAIAASNQLQRRHLLLTNELGLANRVEHRELIHQTTPHCGNKRLHWRRHVLS